MCFLVEFFFLVDFSSPKTNYTTYKVARNEKIYMGFLIHEIQQILKHFAGSFH